MKRRYHRMPLATLALVTLLLGIVLAGCGGAPKVDWELQVTGAVSQPLTVSYAELVGMEQVDLSDVLMEKSLGEDETHSWSGVPLEALFAQAGVSDDYTSVTALAADGYAIEISRDELADAIVALKKNGEWIEGQAEEQGKGPIRLVSPETPANRWVFQLQEIQVNE